MVKKSPKKTSKKATKKHKTMKKHKPKRMGSKKSSDFLKKYPGLTIAIIFGLIVFVSYAYLAIDSTTNQRSENAEELSQMIKTSIEYSLADIELTLQEDLENTLEDDYLLSDKDTIEWLKEMEQKAYYSYPLGDAEYREAAIFLFIDFIAEVDSMTTYDFGTPNMEKEIEDAKANQFENPDVISDVLLDLPYSLEENEKIKIHFNELFDEYVKKKRFLLESDYPIERKYVEARKINYIGFIDSE